MSKSVRDAALGAVATIVAAVALMLLTGAWTAKESVEAHRNDITALRADMRRMLDLLCADRAAAPQCRP